MSLATMLIRTASRVPVMGKLVSFYRYLSFDLPRSTTALGVGLLLGIEAIRLYWLSVFDVPAYLGAYYILIGAFATLAALALLAGPWPAIVRAGWAVGSLVAFASLLMYIVSRTLTLPGLSAYAGRWDYAPGTFAMALSAGYLGIHFAVLTRLTVAWPSRQRWYVPPRVPDDVAARRSA